MNWTSKVHHKKIHVLKTLYNRDKKSENRAKTAVLAHADHIQHVIAREQPIRIKRKRSSKYSTAHRLSTDTNYIWLTSLDTILPY